MTATLTKWYAEKGRHEIFAGGKSVNLDTKVHKLKLNEADVAHGLQHDLDEVGIAKNAREEKTRARDEKLKLSAKDAQMEKLYREHVLKEKPVEVDLYRSICWPSRSRLRKRTRKWEPSATRVSEVEARRADGWKTRSALFVFWTKLLAVPACRRQARSWSTIWFNICA